MMQEGMQFADQLKTESQINQTVVEEFIAEGQRVFMSIQETQAAERLVGDLEKLAGDLQSLTAGFAMSQPEA